MATKWLENARQIFGEMHLPAAGEAATSFSLRPFCVFSWPLVANSPECLSADRSTFRATLAAWFERHRRPLPWRTKRSLYRTVVSEFMLQQTQVATVLPYFERWMRALPDFAALAATDEATVMKLWEGLGYYRRARNLHALAKAIATMPEPPRSAAEWETLPGVGPYTAAAIASISFDDPAACVDGNVVRILARLSGEERKFPDGSSAVRHFTPLATALLDQPAPGRHNEAMMELGATVCLRRNPLCTVCPVLAFCAAAHAGNANDLPRIERAATERRLVDRIWLVSDDALLLHRIPNGARRMNGLFELPTAAQAGLESGSLDARSLIATRRRAITRFQITERIFRASTPADRVAETPVDLEWVPLAKLGEIALSGPHRRWVEELLAQGVSAST